MNNHALFQQANWNCFKSKGYNCMVSEYMYNKKNYLYREISHFITWEVFDPRLGTAAQRAVDDVGK